MATKKTRTHSTGTARWRGQAGGDAARDRAPRCGAVGPAAAGRRGRAGLGHRASIVAGARVRDHED